jgi:hypothetical protein
VTESQFETLLYEFLGQRRYIQLDWQKDKTIRDTGPFQNGTYFGTHPAVRVYYSPEMIDWLEGGRQGQPVDGAMLIKEMYEPPAARYEGRVDQTIPNQWTVMVRDQAGAHDGWFWSYFSSNPQGTDPPVPQPVDNDDFPFNYPDSGFGLYCVRCHGSAQTSLTFASTENIEGFPGQPQVYAVDDSWITSDVDGPVPHPNDDHDSDATVSQAVSQSVLQALSDGTINQEFLDYFNQFPPQSRFQVQHLPPVTRDHVVAKAHRQFFTSDQCLSCHSGDVSPFGPNLVKDDVDVSPYGEWNWSMMGLAGRDPIFYAQLETEVALHTPPGGDFTADSLQDTCLRCHGVMGQRQFTTDNPGSLFTVGDALASEQGDPHSQYGGLARDGVSCMVCHQIPDQSGVPFTDIETGLFRLAPATDGLRTIFGQYPNPTVKPMVEALGALPVLGEHMQDSLVCGSCHTVNLPVLDNQGKTVAKKYEQSTYFEWQNSVYSRPGPEFKSCQQCHMPDTFHGPDPLRFKIANVQDQDFPIADGVSTVDEITVEPRDGYRRHELAGINVFALELFRQYPDILGVRNKSFMTGFENGLENSINNSLNKASHSAQVEILSAKLDGSVVESSLKVSNLTGHRLPSGVGFRRMFIELLVKDAQGQVVWASGRSNDLGVIVDGQGQPLPSESFAVVAGQQTFEPHHQVIDSEAQAQIYGELHRDTEGQFSTSFLSRASEVKDNRLLPKGWTPQGPAGFNPAFAEATHPAGTAAEDPDFVNGSGSDTLTYRSTLPNVSSGPFSVEARLYYQSIPPFYLQDRFNQASGPATRRLHYMASRLNLEQTSFPGWKLSLAQTSRAVTP